MNSESRWYEGDIVGFYDNKGCLDQTTFLNVLIKTNITITLSKYIYQMNFDKNYSINGLDLIKILFDESTLQPLQSLDYKNFISFFEMDDLQDKQIGDMSKNQLFYLKILVSLFLDDVYLFIDFRNTELSDAMRFKLLSYFRSHNLKRIVIIKTDNINLLEFFCNKIVLSNKEEIKYIGYITEIKQNRDYYYLEIQSKQNISIPADNVMNFTKIGEYTKFKLYRRDIDRELIISLIRNTEVLKIKISVGTLEDILYEEGLLD